MTTGRINQVAARVQDLLQLGEAHESHPLIRNTRNSLSGKIETSESTECSRREFPHLHSALSTYRLACARTGRIYPHGTGTCDTVNSGVLLFSPSRWLNTRLPRLDARTCPARETLAHGVCLRARARSCAFVSERCSLETDLPYIYSSDNRTCVVMPLMYFFII